MSSEERTYESKVTINVLAYLMGQDSNEAKPYNVVRENPVQLRFNREKSMIGKKNDRANPIKDYRELGE